MVDTADSNIAARNDYWIVDWRNTKSVPNELVARKCMCVQQLSKDEERNEPVGALCLQLRHPGNLKKDKKKCMGDWADAVWSHKACQLDDIMVVLLACSLQLHHKILPQYIHIFSADKSILDSLNIDFYTSPPDFEARLFARLDGAYQPLTGSLRIGVPDLVFMCQHMNWLRPGFHDLKLGKEIPNPTPSERTWLPGRPHPILSVFMPSVTMTDEEAKAALIAYSKDRTPEKWEKAFQGFLVSADHGRDTNLRMNWVAAMVHDVQTVEQAIALVSRRGTLFKYLPKRLQASIPVKVAAVAGSRSLTEIKVLVDASGLKSLLDKVPVSSEAHKILEMTLRILKSPQNDALEEAKDLKLEFSSHPDWPAYFHAVE
jgi:hypothetical protein